MASAAAPSPDSEARMTAVIVLYQKAPGESEAYLSLQEAAAFAQNCGFVLTILLVDNTPSVAGHPSLPPDVEYRAAARNEGLAPAYNWALQRAEQNHSTWLLTLDQDTRLPVDFLRSMVAIAGQVHATPVVAAIVPRIVAGGRLLSPYRFIGGAVPSWNLASSHGVSPHPIFAFNSGALLRVSVLRQIGGYDPWFWLDCSDALLFHQLHRFGKQVFVAGQICVEHDFSMLDLGNRVSPSRYRNILLAESAFWDRYMNMPAGWERTARLLLRMIRQLEGKDAAELRSITFEFLKRRLFWTRGKRTRAWESETRGLSFNLSTPHSNRVRPKVSVCMAAYNGAPFIEQQLRSILPQLLPGDEIIVVDDASTDETTNVIRSLMDPLIHLICNPNNLGVVASFEKALRNASGDILFLSDGDDLWAANKVQLFLEAFASNPEVDLITSHISFIDGTGALIESDLYRYRKVFKGGFWANLLHNHFQGAAMALRASRLHSVLPFPKGVLFLHDHWIGMRHALTGGSALCLEQHLLFYRRHGKNLSGKLPRTKQIKLRLQLLWAHLITVLHDLA